VKSVCSFVLLLRAMVAQVAQYVTHDYRSTKAQKYCLQCHFLTAIIIALVYDLLIVYQRSSHKDG